MTTPKKRYTELRVVFPPEIYAAIQEFAKTRAPRLSDWVREIVLRELNGSNPATEHPQKRSAKQNERPVGEEWQRLLRAKKLRDKRQGKSPKATAKSGLKSLEVKS